MAKRLTDKQRKQIVADYVQCGNYSEVSRKHKVSATTVKNTILSDPANVVKCEQKKEQNTLDMLDYLDGKTEKVQLFIDKCIDEMIKDGRLESARLSEITTAMGTVIDKFTMSKSTNQKANDTNIIAAIEGAAEDLFDDAPDFYSRDEEE